MDCPKLISLLKSSKVTSSSALFIWNPNLRVSVSAELKMTGNRRVKLYRSSVVMACVFRLTCLKNSYMLMSAQYAVMSLTRTKYSCSNLAKVSSSSKVYSCLVNSKFVWNWARGMTIFAKSENANSLSLVVPNNLTSFSIELRSGV